MMYTYLCINGCYETTGTLCMWRMSPEIGGIIVCIKCHLYIFMYKSLLLGHCRFMHVAYVLRKRCHMHKVPVAS